MLQFNVPQRILRSSWSIRSRFCTLLSAKADTMTEDNETEPNVDNKRSSESEDVNESKKQKTNSFVRIKKRNYAMMLGYFGKNYYGMQRNPGMKTIEEDLIQALLKADLIDSDAFETIQNINFQRAARTDKGVSAVRQVVSLKLPENPSKDAVNQNLPEDIRVFAIKRVTRGFNSKSQCDARTYSYTLPTFAFAPENLEQFHETEEFHDPEKRMQQLTIIEGKPYQEYRLAKDKQEKLIELLKLYEGTHKFHNFTSKVFPLDPRARRFIMSFTAEEPFVVDGMEYITMKVKGQSFMLHQIRKMVSMIIAIMRNIVPKEDFDQAFAEQRYDVLKAPGLGLMLNIVHYDYYNNRYGKDGMHETLDWAECEEEIKEFERSKILQHVFDTELNEKSMLEWLAFLNTRSYGLRDESKSDIKEEEEKKEKEEKEKEEKEKSTEVVEN